MCKISWGIAEVMLYLLRFFSQIAPILLKRDKNINFRGEAKKTYF